MAYATVTRLYADQPLSAGASVSLDDAQSHYLRNVLRLAPGARIALFNARDGEWWAEIESLGNHGLRVVPSACNFLLVLFEGDVSAETVYNRLMDAGYIVRWLPGQGLPGALRMTIGTEDETRGLAAAIRAAVEG